MKSIGTSLMVSGVFLMALSGLEKVLIFTSISSRAFDLQAVINFTPSYFWDITNATFWFGLLFLLVGLVALTISLSRRRATEDS